MINLILVSVWETLTSRNAIFIYIALLIIIFAVLIVFILFSEKRREQESKDIYKDKTDNSIDALIEVVGEKLDDKTADLEEAIIETNKMVRGFGGTKGGRIEYKPIDGISEEKPSQTTESRFYMLTEIDKRYENYIPPRYNDKISLYDICENFRNFACNKLKLYYDISDIRRFIAGLSVTKLLILQGMSGTGKTSLAYAFGEFLDNKTIVVPIQPMWKERTDLIGYYNEFTKKFNETTLLYKMYEADNNKEIYITVLDEMNIARVEYYFAEFLSLLELPNPEGRNLDVVSDVWENDPKLLSEGKLRLPINMWFIGTANNDDSTFSISDKVYDRAMVLNLDKKAEPFEAPEMKPLKLSIDHLEELFNDARKEYDITDRNLRRIRKLDKYLIDTFHITFGNRIMKQIRSYVPVMVACGGEELEALDDILSRKVLRKLESKNPVYVRSQADALISFIEDLFGENKLPLCIEAIRTIEQNV